MVMMIRLETMMWVAVAPSFWHLRIYDTSLGSRDKNKDRVGGILVSWYAIYATNSKRSRGDDDHAGNNDVSRSCSLVTDRSSRSDNSISGAAPPACRPPYLLPGGETDLFNPSSWLLPGDEADYTVRDWWCSEADDADEYDNHVDYDEWIA